MFSEILNMNNEEILQLKREMEELKRKWKSLEAGHSIPLNIDQALRSRLGALTTSTKGVDTEDVTVVSSVNFGAQTVGTTVVQNDPDIFLKVEVGGVTYHIPAYTS